MNKYNQIKAQREDAYKFIRSYVKEHGHVPTYHEIAAEIDVSEHTAGIRVRDLRDAGMIIVEKPGVKYGYRLSSKEEVEEWRKENL